MERDVTDAGDKLTRLAAWSLASRLGAPPLALGGTSDLLETHANPLLCTPNDFAGPRQNFRLDDQLEIIGNTGGV